YFACEAASVYGCPASARYAARHAIRRAASVSTAVSAMSSCTSWNAPIERPNCFRSPTYARHASTHPAAIPTEPAASEMRPLSSADIATLKPAPTSPRRVRDAHAVEEELGGVLRAEPELAVDRPGREALRGRRHEEAGDAARALATRAREDERHACPRAERDEDLRAVDHPRVAVALCARDERRRVRAAARLRQGVATERGAVAQLRQPLRLLRVRAPLRDRLARKAVVDGDDP